MNKRRMSLLASLLVLLTACSAPAGPEQGTEGVLVYYLLLEEEARGADRIGARWESLALPEGADDLAEAQAVVERLMAGPGDESMYSPLPEGVELLGLELRDRTRPAQSLWEKAGPGGLLPDPVPHRVGQRPGGDSHRPGPSPGPAAQAGVL